LHEALKPLLLLGAGTFAQEIADLVTEIPGWTVAGFVEGLNQELCREPLMGLPIYWIDDVAHLAANHWALGAIGTTRRAGFIARVATLGFRFATVVHPFARVSPSATLGSGTFISAGAIVAAHTTLGSHVLLNRGALVGHHVDIGSYATISPGANIGGSCRIGAGAYIGMSAVVIDHMAVGAHSVVGAGAVVTRDVAERVMVVGVPARVVRDNVDGL
jgi:sugar O-acyltransferase (sialic acid O-acetyltransferase NeuD family)